jgi:hypothetical protein
MDGGRLPLAREPTLQEAHGKKMQMENAPFKFDPISPPFFFALLVKLRSVLRGNARREAFRTSVG